MTLNDALNEFLFEKRINGLDKKSVKNYHATLSLFVNAVGSDLAFKDVSFELVRNYILNLLDSSLSRATASSYIRNLKIFLRWIAENYELPFDPLKIKVPKSPKKNVHIYSDSEILKIFSTVETSVPWITARNRAIIALMLDSGLRQCEVCGLLKQDVDRENKVMKVTGKGAKDRMVPLGSVSSAFIDQYLDLCPFKKSKYVFLDRRGNFLSCNAVRLFVYRLERKLPFPFSSHKLRHNFATNFCIDNINAKGDSCVYDLSVLMGHESIETTKKYEHFAHELIAAKNNISHLDMTFKAL